MRLPANPKWYFSGGAICGLIIVDAVDTVVSLAMFTMDRLPKGTVYHHTHFLRVHPGVTLSSKRKSCAVGKATASAEVTVKFFGSGELVARASAEFAF